MLVQDRSCLVIPSPDLIDLATARVEEGLGLAKESIRKRALIHLGSPEDEIQRLVNCFLPGTYVSPHVHNREHPKWESFTLLYGGPVVAFIFYDDGSIEHMVPLKKGLNEGPYIIPPNNYHSILALEPAGVLEMLDQPYNAETHKTFSKWAPREDGSIEEIEKYQRFLRDQIKIIKRL